MYELHTDGDYSLRTPDKFGCTEVDSEYYAGEMDIINEDKQLEKIYARSFLEKFLCDGLHILYTHYYLMKDFYEIIDELCKFITHNDSGYTIKELSGNYDGTRIGVAVKGEETEND